MTRPVLDRCRAMAATAALIAMVILGTTGARDADAALTYFVCSPTHVAAFSNRVHVRCVPPAESTIYYFAVCSATDSAFASRALSILTTAKVTGQQVAIYYDTTDTSGTGCGCSTSDCRVLTGAELLP